MSTIAPNDPSILYSPYGWDVDASRAMTINCGAYLRALISGAPSDLVATFDLTDTSTPPASIDIRINRGAWQQVVLSSSVSLLLPSGVVWDKTEIEIINGQRGTTDPRWTSPWPSAVKFTGLSSASTAIAAVPIQARPNRLLAIGDSLAEGISTRGTAGHDSRMSWAFGLGERLNAEIGVNGWGGTGYLNVGTGNVPAFDTTWDNLRDGVPRDFTDAPDWIVINGGTNDNAFTDTQVTTAVADLLNAMLSTLPDTLIVVLEDWLGRKAAAIQAGIAACADPARVTWVDTTGWLDPADTVDGTHPRGYANAERLWPRIAAAVKSATPPLSTTRWIMHDGALTRV